MGGTWDYILSKLERERKILYDILFVESKIWHKCHICTCDILSSLTRDWTHGPYCGRALNTGLPEKSLQVHPLETVINLIKKTCKNLRNSRYLKAYSFRKICVCIYIYTHTYIHVYKRKISYMIRIITI